MKKENHNNKRQDIEITEIKRDVCWIKKDLEEIKNNHLAHINRRLDKIDTRFWGILVTLLAVLLTAVISLLK